MGAPFFPLGQQHERLPAKVVAALERLGHVLVAVHGRAGMEAGLTSLQVFLLLELSGQVKLGVRELAARFSVSRPTVSRSLAILQQKRLVQAASHPEDARRVLFSLTRQGKKLVASLGAGLQPLLAGVEALTPAQQAALWEGLLAVLGQWERMGLMSAARTCPTCRFFRREPGKPQAFCELLARPLTVEQLRLDCPEHQQSLE